MLKRLLSALAVLALLLPATTFAQTGTISGTVTEAETGNTLPGVNIALVELNQGAATGPEGQYTIEGVPEGTYTLRATFVGYQDFTTEVTVEANETVTQDIELQSGAVGLEEVVVTGYGQQKTAGELTGSVSNISAEEIENVPAQNAQSLLQGRAAGVTLSATSGNPGAGFEVDIRGQGSINAGNRPLYIIDGVQVSFNQGSELTDRSPLNSLSPGDIKSIQVLKDAAAASIYGAQAANGVVLIETKSGRAGDVEVSLNFEGGVRFQSRRFEMANRDQWAELNQEAFKNVGFYGFRENILPAFGYASDTPVSELRDFDWQDWLFDPGGHRKFGFSASGGDESTQFFLSGSLTNTGGALKAKAVNYNNKNVRVNLDQRFTENLDVVLNLGLNKEESKGVCQDGFFINCPFYQGISEEPPISFPYSDDGTYNPNTEQAAVFNPALFLNEEKRTITTTQLIGALKPTYQITSWLTAKSQFSIDWQDAEEFDYSTPEFARSSGGVLSRRFNDVTNMTLNATLNADYTFGDSHNLSGVVGTEYRREFEQEEETGYQGFNNNLLRVPAAASEVSFFQGFNTEFRLFSYFGRVNYDFDGRYIATLTARYDGTSRFGANQRFGLFPSASLGWRISEENFFNVDAVDNLKLRVSYGVTGNSDIGNFSARGLYNIGGSYRDQVGIRPGQLANPQLTWEENRELNVGLDWSLWGGRLTGSVNAYRSNSDELLLNRPLPISSGYGSITENAGQVRNEGIEFQLSTVNIQTEDFRWSTRFNFSVTQNEVVDLVGDREELNSGSVLPIAEGHAIEAWKVPIWAGVNPADGRPLWYDKDGNLTYRPTQEDRKFVNGAEEDVVGGFGTRLSYGGLSLDVFFDYSFGAQSLPFTQTTWTDPFGENVLEFVVEERWEKPGDVARYPRPAPFGIYDLLPNSQGADSPDQTSTNWLYKNNYIRLKSARISYQMPESVLGKIGLSGARVYVTGLNLLQWTPYLGIDPEVSEELESSSYPAEQQINVGLQVDL
ncbi:MAG: SusC/RagA family TonB-linked outer membrane protein [Salinibacter sp.]